MAVVSEIMQEGLRLPRTDRSYLAKKSFTVEEMKTFQRRSREIREGSVKPLTLEQLQRKVARLA